MTNFKYIFVFLFCFLIKEVHAQVYPVQGTATLLPPYALRLSDYTTSTAERFVLNALLADVTKADLHVRFRISITGQNVKLETKPEFIGSMITMQGGVPLRLTNMELAEYFDPNHLNFSGISKSDFLKTGILPEGFYQFCFEVYEYNRGVKISNTICAPAWLILNDPPLINLPLSGTKLKPLFPQNVMMQWTPRHTGSPNAAFTTEYEVKVVEIWPANRNPNDAILSQPAIYETTTNSTSLVYGPDATQLEPGRTYAFRVQAKAMTGSDQLDLFKNNGYSETVAFVYGDACDAPVNITAQTESPTRFSLQWDASPSQTGYTVQYRVKDQPGASSAGASAQAGNWYTSTSLITTADIGGLQPNTTYEYQVMSTCGAFESTYGNLATITTEDMAQKGYSCGVAPNNFNLDPSQLIPILKVGDVVNAGDFDVTITKVTGANGNFSGEGAVVVPFLNQVRGRVAFDNIAVNNDKRMVNGFMNVTGGGIEIVPSGVLNAMDQLSQVLSIADSALNLARELVTPVPDPNTFVADTSITVAAGISKVYKDVASGNIIVVDNNGQTQAIPPGKNLAITDSAGKGVLVNKQGGVTNTTAALAAATAKREYNLTLTFAKTENSKLGFDEQKIEALKGTYEKLDKNYFVSWKAVDSSKPDAVNATFAGKGVDVSKIKFEQDGNPVTATNSGTTFTMLVAAVAYEIASSIVAKGTSDAGKEQVLGKLNVVGYNGKPVTLHIVRVNDVKFNADTTTIRTQLNQIYAQALVSCKVDVAAQSLKVDGLATPFDDGGSGLLSNYTGDMKAVINAFGDLKDDEYYLFLIDKPASGSKLGYMPRSKQAGFIFTEPNGNDAANIIHTMAHEVGHGAFTLKHTFAEYTSIAQASTDNLMDYNNGSVLWKYQWDQIHDPAVVLGLFESDDAGASVSVGISAGIVLDKISSFVTPAGMLITLPAKSEIFYACGAKDYFERGSLLSFKVGGTMYYGNAEIYGQRNFINYISTQGTYPDKINESIQIASANEFLLVNQDPEDIGTKVDLVKAKTANPVLYSKDLSGKAITFVEQLKITEEATPVKSQTFPKCSDNSGKIVMVGRSIQKLPLDDAYSAYANSNLNDWLSKKGSNAHVFISRCDTKELVHFSAGGKENVTDAKTYDSYKAKYDNGTFDGESAIWACWDGKNWNTNSKFKDGVLNPDNAKIKGELNVIKSSIEDRITAIQKAGVGRDELKTINAGEDGEIKQAKLDLFQLIVTVRDVAKDVVNNAKVPEQFWNSKDKAQDYANAGIHIPALLSGAGDQTLDEVTSSVQFVSFALDIATEPKIVTDAWDKIKKLKTDDIKKLVVGAAQDKYDKYAQGGVIARHEGGKDGVQVAMVVFGAIKKLGDKAKDVVENADEVTDLAKKFNIDDAVKKNYDDIVDEASNKKILKSVNEGDLTPDDLTELVTDNAEEFVLQKKQLPQAVIDLFIKGKKYEKKINNKINNLDADYYKEVANKLGIDADDLKKMDKIGQLQINLPNGNYFIADNSWVKKIDLGNNKFKYEVIINETKLSTGTDWTKRQKEFKEALQSADSKFTSRSIKEEATQFIPKDADVTIKSVIRTSGTGEVSDSFNLEKVF